jgi:tRNA wybutosine-synthesizing protein 1
MTGQSKLQVFSLMGATAIIFLTLQRLRATSHAEHHDEPLDETIEVKPVIQNVSERGRYPGEIQLVNNENSLRDQDKIRILSRNTITIVHGSVTGTCAKFATEIEIKLKQNLIFSSTSIQIGSVEEWDWWDELLNNEEDTKDSVEPAPVVILILPTHEGGNWPIRSQDLEQALNELQQDWRVENAPLRHTGLHIATFGMGSSAYQKNTIGRPAKEAWQKFRALGAKSIGVPGIGDDAIGDHATLAFQDWLTNHVVPNLERIYSTDKCGCGKVSKDPTCCSSKRQDETEELNHEDDVTESEGESEIEPDVMDMEDMGSSLTPSVPLNTTGDLPEMTTPSQAAALKKEGYRLIGTHSAVKLCRWTKHQLRGRGGCYKHTFYGITSYQCMEATPSLACANKCVFCWRHHKNPVGKEWKWKTDDPYMIIEEAVQQHIAMIKETKGIPGIMMDRWNDAHTVRHCALSLVGEPIMYPRIDELLGELHRRKISTFLVTNGQHPQKIASIRPITQLYVSVDAPTPETLIAIDRPLFQDAWERLQMSLSMLKDKGQRTVARLTVVKGWNSDEIEGYAKLIALGYVSLVEVKGVTFCGKSDASNLNMSNTPWHHEVVALVQNLKVELDNLRRVDPSLPEYDLACEHKHSVSVLLARVDYFAVDDAKTGSRVWRTWINYEKFQELAACQADDPSFTFGVQDYLADTPSWALFGASEEGFDPTDYRHRKKQKMPKYIKFDENGIPTHDHRNRMLTQSERQALINQMREKKAQIGSGTTVTELRGGEKQILDASLMFRGQVITGA